MRSLRVAITTISLFLLSVSALAAVDSAVTLVPADATTVALVRVSEMRTSPITGRLFVETEKAAADGEAQRFLREAGLDPAKDVDVFLVALAPGTPQQPRVLVVAEGRFDPARLSAAVESKGAQKKVAGGTQYFVTPDQGSDGKGAVAFISSRIAIAGTEAAVAQALGARASGGTKFRSSRLGSQLASIDRNATSWLIVDVQNSKRLGSGPAWEGSGRNQALNSALKNVSFVNIWARDTGAAMQFSATAMTADSETRELLEDTVRGLLSAWRLAVQDKVPELVSVIRRFDVDRDRDGVTLSGTVPAEMIDKLTAKAGIRAAK